MKKLIPLGFLLLGVTLAIVSCAPVYKLGLGELTGSPAPIKTSFLEVAMFLAFANLFTLVGVILYARRFPESNDGAHTVQADSSGWTTLVSASPGLLYLGLPMMHLLAPLWLWRRSMGNAPLQEHARRTLNFQIAWTLFAVVALMLCVVVVGILMLAALLLLHFVVTARATWRSHRGRTVTYPFNLVFVR